MQAVIDNYNDGQTKEADKIKCTAVANSWKEAEMKGQPAMDSGVCWFDSTDADKRCTAGYPKTTSPEAKGKKLFCPCTTGQTKIKPFTRKAGLSAPYKASGEMPSDVQITHFSLNLNQFTADAYECLSSYSGATKHGEVASRPEMLWTVKALLQDTLGTWRSKVVFKAPEVSSQPLVVHVWIYASAAEMMGIGTMLAPEKFHNFEKNLLAKYKELELCRTKVDKKTTFSDRPILPAHVQPSGYWSPVVDYMDMPEMQGIASSVSGNLMLKVAGVAGVTLLVGLVGVQARSRHVVKELDQTELVASGDACDE